MGSRNIALDLVDEIGLEESVAEVFVKWWAQENDCREVNYIGIYNVRKHPTSFLRDCTKHGTHRMCFFLLNSMRSVSSV